MSRRLWLFAFLVLGCVGCHERTPGDARDGSPKREEQASGAFNSQENESPRYVDVEVLVDHSTCSGSVHFTPQQRETGVEIKHGAKIGHPGEVSEVSWNYLGTTKEGDRYHFAWTYPEDSPSHDTTVKDVVYHGEPLTVFEAGKKRIVIRPLRNQHEHGGKAESPPGNSDRGNLRN
jgi:hypothetical protein